LREALRRWARQPETYLLLAVFILVGHGIFYSRALGYDTVDDAYISYRYAQNAARGYGLTFNAGERRVEGYTNFLWTVMMIPAFVLGVNVTVTSIVLGVLFALGCLYFIYRATGQISGLVPLAGLVAVLLLAVDGSFALWSVGGLETSLFALLILAGAVAYIRELQGKARVPVSGAWFALAAMTRPEGLLVLALTLAHQVAYRLSARRRLITRADLGRVGLFAAIFVPYFLFRWRYYGWFFPNTFYAKVTLEDTAAQWQRGLAYVQTFIHIHLGYIPLLVALIPLFRPRSIIWASYVALIVVVYSIYIVYVGGDWSVGRFFAPLMPLYYLLLGDGLVELYHWVKKLVWGRMSLEERSGPSRLTYTAAGVLLFSLLVGFFWASSPGGEQALFLHRFDASLAGQARTQMGKWLHEHVPPDTVIAVNREELESLGKRMGEGTPGHEKLDMRYIIDRRPDYIIIYGTMFDGVPEYERVDLPWTDNPQAKAFLSVYKLRE
jgi:arabinofuranosyltransferase